MPRPSKCVGTCVFVTECGAGVCFGAIISVT